MRTLLTVFTLAATFACNSAAQSAYSYYVAGDSSGIIDASLTMENGNMGSCTHIFTDSLALSGPGGLLGNDNFNDNTYSATSSFTMTWNTKLTVGADGPYPVTTSSSAFCDCIDEEFYNSGGEGTTIYPVPAIQSLENLNTSNNDYTPFQPYVDTPESANQYLVIWGLDLTAEGASDPPYITVNGVGSAGGAISVTGFHLYSGWYVGETDATGASQINIPYSVDATATSGTYTLALTTVGGITSVNFTVGDATPVISGIYQNGSTTANSSFVVGATVSSVVISGQHFGTVCPALSITFTYTVTNETCSDTAISFTNFTATSAASNGTLTLTDEGYGIGFAPQTGATPTASTGVSAAYAAAPTITQNPTMLWYFGAGLTPPPTFSLGGVQTTLSAAAAGGAPAAGGTFRWTITAGSSIASFASGTAQTAVTTSVNTAVLYSISYSTSAGDLSISLAWTDSTGAVHSTATYSLSVDSPFKLSSVSVTDVIYVKNCETLATGNPEYGWDQQYLWLELSKFGLAILGQSLNENFANATPVYPDENWPAPMANGSAGVYGSSTFTDNYCKLNPPNQPPQAFPVPSISSGAPSVNLVDWANQYYAIGTTAIGGGIQVQSQVLQRYIQNPALQSIKSPVRSQ